jgi:glucosamine--fructose-6-phosphate aminotransferase (isomerizing)
MCGIVGYIGYREAYPILLNGLKRLEYRGYDSAGIALLNGDQNIHVFKRKGKVKDLEEVTADLQIHATIGMGHTRWATHGEPNDINAHPHLSYSRHFAIIHNGIIENYLTLKEGLLERGYTFTSETDTEVLVHLIEEIYKVGNVNAETAVRLALQKVTGAFGLLIMCKSEPNILIAARRSSPLLVGIGEGEYFVASDATPIIGFTKNVIYLNDNDIAIIKTDELTIKTIKNIPRNPEIQTLELELESIEKGGYEHFMLKEIYEQPRTIHDGIRGRVVAGNPDIRLGGFIDQMDKIANARRILIVGCGTSWHAGLIGKYLIEDMARIPVEVDYASEFRYRNPVLSIDDVMIAISQSGETMDTLAAIHQAKGENVKVLGVCNVVGASIPRLTDGGVYVHAGPEIGVASTKAFTSQVTALMLIAIMLGRYKGLISDEQGLRYTDALLRLPDLVQQTLDRATSLIPDLAEQFKDSQNFLYLGRGMGFPVALEGALKLKEISYIHAEGYPAAEMKHGPIALIDENLPVVFIACKDRHYEKIIANIQEVKARRGIVIAVVTEGDTRVADMADYLIEIPEADEILLPVLAVIPLQLLAYHIAVLRGCNVDQPRNLAKSVTVE